MIQIRSARPADLPGIAAVLQDAFSDKMQIIFGRRADKVQKLLEAIYTGPVRRGYAGIFVAERDGRVIGTLLVEPMHHTSQENRAFESLLLRELGLVRTLRAAFLLWLFSHDPASGEAYISDVGVASDSQGQGVAQRMLAHAENWARSQGRTSLTLWVAGTNPRAIHVYEKGGLATTRTRSSWLTRLAFGIRHWHFMEKTLD